MTGYYQTKLAGERLQRCYEVASPRIRQYLQAELAHVSKRLRGNHTVLELGCGYGRAALRFAEVAHRTVGIDTAPESLELANRLDHKQKCEFIQMDAAELSFSDGSFDAVVCIQNGICAFGVDRLTLVREALRVTRLGGVVLFSSYSDRFWPERFAWFEAQAAEGLVGPLDPDRCINGWIVCQDGFRAGRVTPDGFQSLCTQLCVKAEITEVDGSCVSCEIIKERARC
jgi:SAM-dependent methyltransferase